MLATLGKIVSSVLRSLFVSIVMFVIVFSLITEEFPPNFGKLAVMYRSFQKLTDLTQQILPTLNAKQLMEGKGLEDIDVNALEELNLKRSELAAGLLGRKAPNSDLAPEEIKALRRQVSELLIEVYGLRQRVVQLETREKERLLRNGAIR